MVEDTACVKKETTDEVVEEDADKATSVKVEEEMKVESVGEAKPDEELKEGVGMQCESGDNTTDAYGVLLSIRSSVLGSVLY